MDAFIDATNAGVGSACSKLIVYPFDLIKTRMATTGKNIQDTVDDLKTEGGGVGGLYKGIGPKMVKSVTGKFFYFYLYTTLSKLRLAMMEDPSKGLDTASNLVIGYFSEILELPIVMPLEAVVSRVQAAKDSRTSALDIARQMYAKGGLACFYVSLDAYILGATQPAIQMSIYDQVRRIMLRNRTGDLSALESFSLATLAGCFAVTAAYPMDMCRCIAQTETEDGKEKKNIFQAMRHILKTEGFQGLFKGLSAQLFQAVLSASIMLMVKERIQAATTRILVSMFVALGLYKPKPVSPELLA
ncbi:Mitochondrial carrier protein [Hondaea fermentalgiana]|uniref:Mitochondrial carrier protein n=1 Tax=Hondaea fermentalgiana TaxID=2315210 RepID=A0A2R5G4J5_9STRA|nr:Mitochondrial carrier protein [Hondaea fermentalgiana]|eukprot:GBG25946.1 Mitochondrial carrier protein [Hondaea fermentalgiana]